MASLPRIWDVPILLFLSIIWASAFTTIKIAVPELGPLGVVFFRCSIGALFMMLFVLMAERKRTQSAWPKNLREWGILSIVGILSTALPFYLISFAEQEISSGLTAIMMTTGPLVVIVLGHIFTDDEKINRGKLLGVIMGFVATLYLLRGGFGEFDSDILYPMAAIGAAACYAVGGLLAKKMVTVSAEVIAFYVLAISALVVAPFYLTENDVPSLFDLNDETFYSVIWLGIMPSGFAFYLRYFLIKRNGYGFVSYVGYLIPLFTIGIGMIILNEQVTIDTFIAMLVILMGLLITRSHLDFPWSAHPRLEVFRKMVN